jgi:hypothetical protein
VDQLIDYDVPAALFDQFGVAPGHGSIELLLSVVRCLADSLSGPGYHRVRARQPSAHWFVPVSSRAAM